MKVPENPSKPPMCSVVDLKYGDTFFYPPSQSYWLKCTTRYMKINIDDQEDTWAVSLDYGAIIRFHPDSEVIKVNGELKLK